MTTDERLGKGSGRHLEHVMSDLTTPRIAIGYLDGEPFIAAVEKAQDEGNLRPGEHAEVGKADC